MEENLFGWVQRICLRRKNNFPVGLQVEKDLKTALRERSSFVMKTWDEQ